MAELNPQDAYLLEKVTDPGSAEYKHLMSLLVKPVDDGRTKAERLRSDGEWKYTFPFKGEPEQEIEASSLIPYRFAERGTYRNGVSSLALAMADLIDLIELSSNRHRVTTTLCLTAEADTIKRTLAAAGGISTLVHYADVEEFVQVGLQVMPEVLIIDHTTVNVSVDDILNVAFSMGVKVVDGVFPYHVAATKGWDVVTSVGKWSYTHSRNYLTIGPDDDCSRLFKYKRSEYLKFLKPSSWVGDSRKYGYEIRKANNALATYRAIILSAESDKQIDEQLQYSLPMCSSEDMILVTINRELASGVFTSKSNNARDLTLVEKDYAIEVRRELFNTCVDYLISKDRGADLVGDSVRYITQHNYVDLVDGLRIVRCPSLGYADASCVAMIAALTAFQYRYRLTNESIYDIQRNMTAAKLSKSAPFGLLGRLAWLSYTHVKESFSIPMARTMERAKQLLYNTDKIPGVCYDVYATTHYSPELVWFESYNPTLQIQEPHSAREQDVVTKFLGESEKTSAPTVLKEKAVNVANVSNANVYIPNDTPDPWVSLQHVYDEVLPGNSVAQVQSAAELRRVKDININTEFHGRIEINKDVRAPERLLDDAPIRTTALLPSNTSLVDAIMASAKRNFNPPDIQMQSDPWTYARYLTDKFVEFAFVDNFRDTIGAAYKKDPITFNVADYLEWRATRDKSYLSALESECPAELVELKLEKFDTIVKSRIKPKLSTTAQNELAQPQVIVASRKTDTALFSSVFRKMFERFDHALRPEVCSAGRMSDDQISQWLTEHIGEIMSSNAIEVDSTKYDKSQGLLARMIEALVLIELGLDPKVQEIFQDSFVGKVSSQALGLMFISAYQMKSGAPDTMLGNIIYNAVSIMEAVGPSNIRLMIVKGDDNVVWLHSKADGQAIVSRMSGLFNLEVKLVSGSVLYFSSGYILVFDGKGWFAPDPIKMIELLGEPVRDSRFLVEQWVSFQDRVRSLRAHHNLPYVLQQSVRARMAAPSADVIMAVDALCSIAQSLKIFNFIKTGSYYFKG